MFSTNIENVILLLNIFDIPYYYPTTPPTIVFSPPSNVVILTFISE